MCTHVFHSLAQQQQQQQRHNVKEQGTSLTKVYLSAADRFLGRGLDDRDSVLFLRNEARSKTCHRFDNEWSRPYGKCAPEH